MLISRSNPLTPAHSFALKCCKHGNTCVRNHLKLLCSGTCAAAVLAAHSLGAAAAVSTALYSLAGRAGPAINTLIKERLSFDGCVPADQCEAFRRRRSPPGLGLSARQRAKVRRVRRQALIAGALAINALHDAVLIFSAVRNVAVIVSVTN